MIHFLPSSPIIHTSGLASNAGSWSGGQASWAKRGEASRGAAPQITKVGLHSSNWGEAGPEGAGGRAVIVPASLPACSRSSLLAVETPPPDGQSATLGAAAKVEGGVRGHHAAVGLSQAVGAFDRTFQGHAWSLALVSGQWMGGDIGVL